MSTAAEYVNITRKRLLGTTDFDDNFLSHLRALVQETHERTFKSSCVYETAITLGDSGADKIALGGTAQATDGDGHILDPWQDTDYNTGIQFENAAAVDYDVALHYCERPVGVQINPRTSGPEFISWAEAIGESGDPNAVVDLGSNIQFDIDNVCEAGVSHAGRKALVFMKVLPANAITYSVAVEECTVTWTGAVNRITTTAKLGQDTISTTASDYTVILLGPTIRRLSSLFDADGYAYIGSVTGIGAGGTPTAFDITQQDVLEASLSDLSDFTRVASNGRVKIDVKAIAGESAEDQIRVTNSAGTVRFRVTEAGDVYIEGDLEVQGTTTQHDVVTVYSDATITDNLTAGDDDSDDSHLIKGEWRHTNTAGTANYFTVDGDTGRIGIGKVYDTSGDWPLDVQNNARFNSTLRISSSSPTLQWRETDIAVDAGGLWRLFYSGGEFYFQENTAVGGDFSVANGWLKSDRVSSSLLCYKHFSPTNDNTVDIGSATREWRNLYIDGTAYVDTLSLSTTAGEGCATTFVPTTTASINLGGPSYRWGTLYATRNDLYHSDNVAGDWTFAIERHTTTGTADAYRVGQYNVITDATAVNGFGGVLYYMLNSASFASTKWVKRDDRVDLVWSLRGPVSTWYDQLTLKYDGGIDTRTILPYANNTYDLGSASYQWANIYVTNLNVGGSILPAADLTYDLGSSSLRWLNLYAGYVWVMTPDPAVMLRDTDQAVDDGGLWRIRLNGRTFALFENTAAAGDFSAARLWVQFSNPENAIYPDADVVPRVDDTYDLGNATRQWSDLYIDGTAYVDTLSLSTTGGEGVATSILPATSGNLSLGTSSYLWDIVYTEYLWLQHAAPRVYWRESDFAIDAGGLWRMVLDNGRMRLEENTAAGGDFSSTQYWINIVPPNYIEFGGSLIPILDDSEDLGANSFQWKDLYSDGTAYVDTLSLSTAAGEGVYDDLNPTVSTLYNLGSVTYRWHTLIGTAINLLYPSNTQTASGFYITRHGITTTNTPLYVGQFDVDSDAVIADGFAGQIRFRIDYFHVGYLQWTRSGANDQANFTWVLNNASNVMTEQLGIYYDDQVKTRNLLPFAAETYNLGSGPYRWKNVYCQYLDSYIYTDTTTSMVFWWSHYAPTVTNELLKLGTYEAATDATPADGLGWYIDYNIQYNTVARMLVERSDADTTAHIYWQLWSGSAFEYQLAIWYNGGISTREHWPWATNTYDLGSSSYQWRNLYVDGTANIDTLALDNTDGLGVGSHCKPTTDGDKHLGGTNRYWQYLYVHSIFTKGGVIPSPTDTHNLGGASNRWLEIYGANIYAWHTTPTVFWRESDRAVDNEGLWRMVVDGGHFRLEENTAAAGDFSTARWWINIEPTTYIGLGGHVIPEQDNQFDLGSSTLNEWRNLYLDGTAYIDTLSLSNAAGEGVSNHLVPAANITYSLGNLSYLWSTIYGARLYITYDSDTVDAYAVQFIRNATTVTSSGILVANFSARTDATAADGFGGYFRYYNEGNLVAYFKWSRVDADTTANLYWYIYNGSTFTTSTVQYYNGDFGTKTHIPLSTTTYNLGSSSNRWLNAYLAGTTFFGTDLNFTAKISVGNPRIDFDSGSDAMWYDRTSNTYVFRVANVTKFQFSAITAIFDTDVRPSANQTYNLGSWTYQWNDIYSRTSNAGFTADVVPGVPFWFWREATTVTNQALHIGLYEVWTGATVADGFGGYVEYMTELNGVAQFHWVRRGADDQCDLYWYLNNASDTLAWQLKLKYDGGAEIQNHLNVGFASTSPPALINAGNPGTPGTTDLRGSHFHAYNATNLPGPVGSRRRLLSIGGASSNEDYITLSQIRYTTTDSLWTTASFRLSREVDNSVDAGPYIEFQPTQFFIKGDWFPSATRTYDLGSSSYRWNLIYGEFMNLWQDSNTASDYCASFTHSTATTNSVPLKLAQFSASSSTAEVNGFGGYIAYLASGNEVGRWEWVRDGADDQYNFVLSVHDGTSLTARMTINWDGTIELDKGPLLNTSGWALGSYTYRFSKVWSGWGDFYRAADLTGNTFIIDSEGTGASNAGEQTALRVRLGRSAAAHSTRTTEGIYVEAYGCGYAGTDSVVYGVRAEATREDSSYNNDRAYGGRFSASDSGSGGTGLNFYGVYASAAGTTSYGVYCTAGTYGLYSPDTKSWVNPHPTDPTKSIVYATVEAERDTALLRGRAQLANGQVTVVFPEHFALTLSELPEEPVHVIVTPRSADSKGIAVISSDHTGFVAVELAGGTGDYEFDYVATGVRRGFEDHEPITDNVDFIPGEGNLKDYEGEVQEYYDKKRPGVQRILKSSGILNAQGKVNTSLFAQKKWRTGKISKPTER